MSYILDALRKADAERERGMVPGIHAQPVFAGASQTRPQRTSRPWIWAVGAVAVALIGAALWAMFGRSASEPAHAAIAAAPAPWPASAPAPAASIAAPMAAAPAPAPAAATHPPKAEATREAQAAAAARKQKQTPAAAAAKPRTTKAAAEPEVAKKSSRDEANASGNANANAGASVPAASADTRVYMLNELPGDIRRQLPNLSVGGSVYSATAANRILIINGQILHEGDKIAPDLLLQQIRLKAAVLAFKGYRYTLDF